MRLCRCGHYEREHTTTYYGKLKELEVKSCSGNTRAWPDDAETDDEGREVCCQCRGFVVNDERPSEEGR